MNIFQPIFLGFVSRFSIEPNLQFSAFSLYSGHFVHLSRFSRLTLKASFGTRVVPVMRKQAPCSSRSVS